jgi:hypothetical protein
MPERPISNDELERTLLEVGAGFSYPATPQLSKSVRARIGQAAAAPRRSVFRRLPSRAPLVALAALLIAVLAAALNPSVRSAVAHFFHVQGVVITRQPSPLPSLPSVPLNLGTRVTLEQAQKAVTFPILVPDSLGTPDAIYLDREVPGSRVALAYLPRPGFTETGTTGVAVLVTESRASLERAAIGKNIGPDTVIEETAMRDVPAYWIAGAPHMVVVIGPDGKARPETLRLAANTLIWSRLGVTYRIESSLSKQESMRIALSMPASP